MTKRKNKYKRTNTYGLFYKDRGSLVGPLHGVTYRKRDERILGRRESEVKKRLEYKRLLIAE